MARYALQRGEPIPSPAPISVSTSISIPILVRLAPRRRYHFAPLGTQCENNYLLALLIDWIKLQPTGYKVSGGAVEWMQPN